MLSSLTRNAGALLNGVTSMATGREFKNGQYWVQLAQDSDPEVALHDRGYWRIHGQEESLETEDFYRIGRRVKTPADAFEDELEQQGGLGV